MSLSLRRKRNQGFSLIELLIVITVILIIAAIAIPKLLTIREQANATAAVGNLRTINNALAAYSSQYPSIGYPASGALTALGPPGSGGTDSSSAADLIDDSLDLVGDGSTVKQGYTYTYTAGSGTPVTTFTLTAQPATTTTGTRYFYMDQSGVITYNDGSAATASSSVLGQ